MTANKTVSATFGPPRPTLKVTAPSTGRITGPAGINCPGSCIATFNLKDFFLPRNDAERGVAPGKFTNLAANLRRANPSVARESRTQNLR